MVERTTSFVAASFFLAFAGNALAAPGTSPILVAETPQPYFPASITLLSPGSVDSASGVVSNLGEVSLAAPSTFGAIPAAAVPAFQARQYFLSSVATPGLDLATLGSEDIDVGTASYFVQTVHGVPVEGTYAVALAQGDTLTYARHHLVMPPQVDTQAQTQAAAAEEVAVRQMAGMADVAFLADGEKTQLVIAHLHDGAKLVWKVMVSTQRPWEKRAVYVDAHDGSYRSFRKVSHDDVSGQLQVHVEPKCIGEKPKAVYMPYTRWNKNEEEGRGWNADTYTDGKGLFKSSKSVSSAEVAMQSPYVRLRNDSGKLAGPWKYDLQPAPADNELDVSPPLDQIDAFYHVHKVRAWMLKNVKGKNAQTRWADDPLQVTVNIRDTCNAYYDGTLNFFSAGDGCLNTGRTAGIMYHEYAHGIHEHSPARGSDALMDGQVSEGIADYVAATLTNNPNMRGIFSCKDNFRSCVNEFTYCSDDSKCDFSPDSEVHDAGQVICGVWWELRESFIARYGRKVGVPKVDAFHLRFLSLVGDMNSAYKAAIAADEDTDKNPKNGTVHSCEINKAFADELHPHFTELKGMVPCVPAQPLVP